METNRDRQRETRLVRELEYMEELRRQSSFIDFVPRHDPPDEYLVTFTCKGMIDAERTGERHVAKVYLHAEFPRLPPQVHFLTPSFHPNIAALIQMAPIQRRIQEMLDRAPDAAARQELQREIQSHEELFTAKVCLDVLDLDWGPMITLDRICVELAEMIQYKHFNTADPLNRDAAIWAETHRDELPVDRRTILDLKALASIRILADPPAAQDRAALRAHGDADA
jgi:ubiquitin-protein ligase